MKNSTVLILLTLFMCLNAYGCVSDNEDANTDVRVPVPSHDPSTSPVPTHNWPVPEFKSTEHISGQDIPRLSGIFGVQVASGENSFYEVDGTEVQLNEIMPSDEADLIPLFHNMFSLVGAVNSIILGTDRVYEIISDNPYAAEAIRHSLDLSPIQRQKITPHMAYGEFTLTGDTVVSDSELEIISERLGFEISELINQEVVLDGLTWQVNFILPANSLNPLEARDKLINWKNSDTGVYALNNLVVEIVTDQTNAAETIWHVINIPPPPYSDIYRFKVRFSAIPIKNADPMKVNDLFNLLLEGKSPHELITHDPTLEFGDSFPLFLCEGRTVLHSTPEITLDPQDLSISIGSIVIPENSIGNPVEVDFDLIIETNRAYERGPEDIVQYVTATGFWPVNSDLAKEKLELARSVSNSDTVIGLVRSLNSWVSDNIEYGGEKIGSRFGVEAVLSQGYGRCWDLSDVFVTLSRTAGLPTRQVAGWVYGGGGGHVWAQVWLDDQSAWVDVDPTLDHVGVTSLYIPIWGTIDGEMLFLYSSDPQIERIGF